MTYTPKLPPRSAILDAWLRGHPFQLSSEPEDREKEFEMWEAHVKAQAWEEAADAMDADPEFRDPLRLKSQWLRNRAQQLKEKP